MEYDKYIVAFSGGKDSIACFLNLLENGIPLSKIELWHHDIDGHGEVFMDWECTPSYCQAFANHFGVPLYFSWKEGGFKREMLRNKQKTAPVSFQNNKKEIITVGGTRGKESTRLKFPQVSPDLSVRWCSAYLKIDVCAIAIRNQERFDNLRTVVISGERGEESAARAKYKDLEIDRADNRNGKSKRFVDRMRPIKNWLEKQVWEIIERWKIRVHPAYYLGWSRVSCKYCIFGNANQFASAYDISPKPGEEMISYENDFKCTIKRKISLKELISKGTPYSTITKELADIATSSNYNLSIIVDKWILPAGAYGDGCGPT